jgi:arylsulfatase A-like enzyme
MMNQSHSLLRIGIACLLLHSATAAKEKMNVLFIIADDLTATAVSSYEKNTCQTPNIDRLAERGTLYSRAYCQVPYCGPSRASLMSGYYPQATGVMGYVSGRKAIGDKRMTWAQNFKNAGYYTARVSKIFHMGVPIDIEQGSNGQDDPASWTERFNSQGPEWKAKGDGELLEHNPHGDKPVKGGNTMVKVEADGDDLEHSDGRTAQKACELIKLHKDEPFFLAVGFVRPHVPFVSPHLQGKSLVKTLDNPSVKVRDAAYCSNPKGFLIRDEKWAYIQYKENASKGIELFNMEKDPKQYHNLAKKPEYAPIVKLYQAKLADKLRTIRDNDLERPAKKK